MRTHDALCPDPNPQVMSGPQVCKPCIAIRRARYAAYTHVLDLIKTGCPDCGEVCLVMPDCCEEPRWECETTIVYDSAGDPDVRVCRAGTGCDVDNEWMR